MKTLITLSIIIYYIYYKITDNLWVGALGIQSKRAKSKIRTYEVYRLKSGAYVLNNNDGGSTFSKKINKYTWGKL